MTVNSFHRSQAGHTPPQPVKTSKLLLARSHVRGFLEAPACKYSAATHSAICFVTQCDSETMKCLTFPKESRGNHAGLILQPCKAGTEWLVLGLLF